MSDVKLEPCPWCKFAAGRDHVQVVYDRSGKPYTALVCGKCKARGPQSLVQAHWSEESGMLDTRCVDDAIAAWNRRSSPSREEGIEEAAKVAEQFCLFVDDGVGDPVAKVIAQRIRALTAKTSK